MKKIIVFISLLAISLSGFAIYSIADMFVNKEPAIKISSPKNNENIVLANEKIYNWYSTYNASISASDANMNKGDQFSPNPVILQWEAEEAPDYYRVKYSENKDLSDAESLVVNKNSVELFNLYTSRKYYWQVEAVYASKTVRSALYSFSTLQSPRNLHIDGVSNTRDIGGYKVSDNKRIKQGMIYRGAYFNTITQKGIENALYDYKIKTDLDLRNIGEGGAGVSSPLGADVNYKNINITYYTNIYDRSAFSSLASAVKVFSDESNYPVYIHCSLGRDRTGTLVFLLSGLLGLDKDTIYMEYAQSFFSQMGTLDNQPLENMYPTFDATYKAMENYGSGSLSENIHQYMLDIGVTAEEIASIKNIMLEEVK